MIYCFDDYELDADKLELRRSAKPVKADAAVLKLLAALVRDAGQLVTKAELIERVWEGRAVSENVISVAMARLRKVLRDDGVERETIANLHGRGYRFVRPVTLLDRPLAPLLAELPSRRRAPPFVGRDASLRPLREALDAARAGRGSVCLLTGEAGIGKSRVAEQIASEAAALGLSIAWGYCHEAGDTPPLWPWAELVRGLLESAPQDAEAHAAARAPELALLLPGRDASVPRAAERPAAKHAVFDAILSVVRAAARSAPCLLVLEDLHRADAATLELLRYWVDPVVHQRALLLGTARRAESRQLASSGDLSYVLGHRNCTRIALERLGPDDVATYVAALVDDRDGRLARAVFDKSEGNPFFMAELGRQLAASAQPDAASLTVPEAALELVRPRVLALDVACRGVLSAAAVIGRSFSLKLLAAVVELELPTLMAILDSAVAREVISIAPDARTTFAFSHDLLRAVLYDELPAGERRRLHLRVAEALEARSEAGEANIPALRAYHLHAALPDGALSATVAACAQAAEKAGDVFAYTDGVRYLRHALEALALLDAPSPVLRMALLLRQAIYARIAGLPEFEALTRGLAQLAREQRDGAMLAHAGRLLDLHPGLPALAQAEETLRDALALLADDEHEARATVLARLATCAPLAFDGEAARAQVERALDHGRRAGSVLALSAARGAELYLFGGPGQPAREADVIRAIEQAHHAEPARLSVQPVLLDIHRAIRALQEGELMAMQRAFASASALCDKLGSRELRWHVERFHAISALQADDGDLTREALRALHRRARDEGIVATELLCVHDELVVLGDRSESLAGSAALTACAADPPNVWSIKVRALAAAGGACETRARSLLRSVPSERLRSLPVDRDHLGTLGALARAALLLDEPSYAHALYDALLPFPDHFAAQVTFYCEGATAALLGDLARALKQRDAARAHYLHAIARSERAGFTWAASQARAALSSLD